VKTRLEGHLTEAPHLTLIKQTAAAFAQDCWNEIPLEIVRETWDMDPSDQWQMMNWMMGRRGTLQIQMVTMVKDLFCDIECDHDGIEISNITMVDNTTEGMK
jgi:hypothetical protein